jgi:hypothetical protein
LKEPLLKKISWDQFSFSTKTDMNVSIDYIPKNQARKIFTYAKEQLDILKNGAVVSALSKKTQLITLMNLRL